MLSAVWHEVHTVSHDLQTVAAGIAGCCPAMPDDALDLQEMTLFTWTESRHPTMWAHC